MRLRLPVVALMVGMLGWSMLAGCGGPMPTPPQPETPSTVEQPGSVESQTDDPSSGQTAPDQTGSQSSRTETQAPSDQFAVAKEIIRQQSCGSCHTIQARGLDLAGRVGPDLTNEGDRDRTDEWLRQHLVEPTSIPDAEVLEGFEGMQSTMPSYGRRLSDEQIGRLVAFLQSLSASEGSQRDEAQAEPSQAEPTQQTQASDDPVTIAKQVIREQGCGSCHTIQARGLDLAGRVGPDLTNEGDRGRTDEWLRRQIANPSSIPDDEVVAGYEGMQSTMPSYERSLSQAELDALVAFLQSLKQSDN